MYTSADLTELVLCSVPSQTTSASSRFRHCLLPMAGEWNTAEFLWEWSTGLSGVLSSSLARCHRILRVRLRFQQSNLQQKNSVYIEFADTASADAALASPPLQPGSSSRRLECLHKQDYEKQQRSFVQSSSLGTSTGKRKQGSADSTGDNAGHFSVDLEQSRTRSKRTSDKAKQIDELQGALQKEQAESARFREIAKQVGMGILALRFRNVVSLQHSAFFALSCSNQ